MLRLTLLSGEDARFMARIIDRDGFPFVLDFGDRRVIEDASKRIQHGFTLWLHGKLISAVPQTEELIVLLAEHYAREGLLVFLEDPMYREQPKREFSGKVAASDEMGEADDETELIDFEDVERPATPQEAIRQVWTPPESDDDDVTEDFLVDALLIDEERSMPRPMPLDEHQIRQPGADMPDDETTEER
jgi:hypothetical protein